MHHFKIKCIQKYVVELFTISKQRREILSKFGIEMYIHKSKLNGFLNDSSTESNLIVYFCFIEW